jgi:hypothetical protein
VEAENTNDALAALSLDGVSAVEKQHAAQSPTNKGEQPAPGRHTPWMVCEPQKNATINAARATRVR